MNLYIHGGEDACGIVALGILQLEEGFTFRPLPAVYEMRMPACCLYQGPLVCTSLPAQGPYQKGASGSYTQGLHPEASASYSRGDMQPHHDAKRWPASRRSLFKQLLSMQLQPCGYVCPCHQDGRACPRD